MSMFDYISSTSLNAIGEENLDEDEEATYIEARGKQTHGGIVASLMCQPASATHQETELNGVDPLGPYMGKPSALD
jgi:hypothetical protein